MTAASTSRACRRRIWPISRTLWRKCCASNQTSIRYDDHVRRLDLLHHEVGMRLLDAAYRGYAIAEKAAIALHVRDSDLQQVVEAPGDHVTLHDLVVGQ